MNKINPDVILAVIRHKLKGASNRQAAKLAGCSDPSVPGIMQEYEKRPDEFQVGLLKEDIEAEKKQLSALDEEITATKKLQDSDSQELEQLRQEADSLDYLDKDAEEVYKKLQYRGDFIQKRIEALDAVTGRASTFVLTFCYLSRDFFKKGHK